MSLRVRPATPDDAVRIAAILGEGGPGAGSRSLAADARIWLALERGEAVGFVATGPGAEGGAGEIRALRALARAWGGAAPHALWQVAGEALAAEGARVITARVDEADAALRALCEREGARPEGPPGAGEPTRWRQALAADPFLRGLAAALSRGERPAIERFLDPEVQFSAPPCAGPSGVAEALLGRAAAPPDALEEQAREVSVQALGADRWRLNVVERLRDGGHAASYRHAFALTLPPGRGVTRVTALDLPGERERLRGFLRRIGHAA